MSLHIVETPSVKVREVVSRAWPVAAWITTVGLIIATTVASGAFR